MSFPVVSLGLSLSLTISWPPPRIRFKFVKNSEYLHVGMRFLLREGKTKVCGS